MDLDTLSLEAALRPNTLVFARDHADRLDRHLEPALVGLELALKRMKGAEALLFRRNFTQAPTWGRYFWARAAHHRLKEGLPLPDALLVADRELLSLSPAIHPL